MQTDVELGIVARKLGGRARGRLRDHQARAAQNPVTMRSRDTGVDLGRQPKSSGVDDEALRPRHRDYRRHVLDLLSLWNGLLKRHFAMLMEFTGLIILFYAFSREIAPFKRRQVERTPLALDGLHGFRAEIGGKELQIIGRGIGHRRADRTARQSL